MAEIFDLTEAKEICKCLPVGGGQTITANIAFMRAYYPAGRMLPAALDEIERLQTRDAAMQTQIVENAKEIERLRADNETLLSVVTAGDTNIIINSKAQAKRIEELEAALIGERANKLLNAAIPCNQRDGRIHKVDDLPKELASDWTKKAREQLHAEGLL